MVKVKIKSLIIISSSLVGTTALFYTIRWLYSFLKSHDLAWMIYFLPVWTVITFIMTSWDD